MVGVRSVGLIYVISEGGDFILKLINKTRIVGDLTADDIAFIRQMPDEQQDFLYGLCDQWARDHFNPDCQIKAVMWKHAHSKGLIHCFLRNTKTQKYIDVRGECDSLCNILRYTGVNVYDDEIELYSFSSVEDFDRFISWVVFAYREEVFDYG